MCDPEQSDTCTIRYGMHPHFPSPQVLREMRVKGAMMDHKEIRAAMGVRVVAPGLEQAVAGTSMFVVSE